MAFVVAAQAQVTVTLVDGEGKPVAEATVEANKKVIGKTDADGSVTLDTSYLNQQLCFSHVSFQLFCEKVTKNVNKFTLKSNDNFLDVAVVTSYENTTRRNTIGNVSSIDMSKVPVLNTSNALSALQGLAPGLDIQVSGGGLGQASKVRVQGDQSLLFAAPPIYVVDGIIISEYQTNGVARNNISPGFTIPGVENQNARGNFIDFLDFNNIESITILKDADAVGIYGSRAANGAIVIKTKKANKNSVGIITNFSVNWQPRRLELMNTSEYLHMRKTAVHNSSINDLSGIDFNDLTLFDSSENNDWQSIIMGHSIINYDIGLNINSISDNSLNRFSFSFKPKKHFYDKDGKFDQLGLNNVWSTKLLNGKINFTNVTNVGYISSKQRPVDLTSFALRTSPNLPKFLFDYNNIYWDFKGAPLYNNSEDNPTLPLLASYKYTDFRIMNSTNIKYDITRFISFDVNYGTAYNTSEDIVIKRIDEKGLINFPSYLGNYVKKDYKSWNHNIDSYLTFNFKDIVKDMSIINITGINYNNNSNGSQIYYYTGNPRKEFSDNIQYYELLANKESSIVNYKYAAFYNRLITKYGKLNFNINFRRDGSSRFSPENRWASFYSFALGWDMSEYDFFKKRDMYIRIRTSYGKLGNDNIPDYGYLQRFSIATSINYPNNFVINNQNLHSSLYKWEDLRKVNLGFDISYRNFSFIFDYSRSVSKDQLINYRIPDYLGQASIFRNFPGVFKIESFEVNLSQTFSLKNNKQITANLLLTFPRNKLVSFPNIENSSYKEIYHVGKSKDIFRLYEFAGVDPATGLYSYFDSLGSKTNNKFGSISNLIELPTQFYGSLILGFNWSKFRISTNIYFVKQKNRNLAPYEYSLILHQAPGSNVNNYRYLLDNYDQNINSKYQKFFVNSSSVPTDINQRLNHFWARFNNIVLQYKFPYLFKKYPQTSLDINFYMNNILLYSNSNVINYENVNNEVLPSLVSSGLMININF